MIRPENTICAPATGSGGAIAILRVSGPASISICNRIFFPTDKKVNIAESKGFTVHFGEIKSSSEIIDEVLVTIFREPHSYTGEDSVEISCHASSYIIRRITELLISNGAESAKPGEFTQRAFMNGRIDLSQAEAVADLIASSGSASHRIAMNQMRGGFSLEISKLRAELLNFASLIELELDFGEEDVQFADRHELTSIITRVKDISDRLSESFFIGNAMKNGIPVAIVGKPNSGKSTLLNSLLMEEKAIVSEIPGTTRDSIEDTVHIDGIQFRFIDTAGLRKTTDIIENLGIERTHDKIKQASIILFMDDIDDSAELINQRIAIIREMISDSKTKLIVLINKTDISKNNGHNEFIKNIDLTEAEIMLFISAKQKTGLEELRSELCKFVKEGLKGEEGVIITNIRHYEALKKVSESLSRVLSGIEKRLPEDLIAIDIRQAIHYLGEITGEITSDEILGNIFKNFCIGK